MEPTTQIVVTIALGVISGLLSFSIGGIVYWLRKLDDRQYALQNDLPEHYAKKHEIREDIVAVENRATTAIEKLDKRMTGIESNLTAVKDTVTAIHTIITNK